MKKRMKKLFLTIVAMMLLVSASAQVDLTGRWQSQQITEDTERLTVEFLFKDSVNMEMAFVTEERVPNVGLCLSRITVQGSYSFIGPLFFPSVDSNTVAVKIEKLELDEALANKATPTMRKDFEKMLETQMLEIAIPLFENVDGSYMLYVSHEDTEDSFTFILGDENNAIALFMNRINKK